MHVWDLGFFAVEQFGVKKEKKQKPNLTETNIFFTTNCPMAKNPLTVNIVDIFFQMLSLFINIFQTNIFNLIYNLIINYNF